MRLALMVAAVLLLIVSPVGHPTSAQEPDLIGAIRVEGNQRIEQATIETYMAVTVGDRFDQDGLDQTLKNLFSTGLFDDVALARDGSVLVISVVENPIINRIAFEGNRKLDDDILESEVQLRPRVVYTRSRVQNAVTRLLELYRRNGRFGATVEPKVIELPENRVDLVFEINEGPITKVDGIIFVGNEAFSDSTLRGTIQTEEAAWYNLLTSDDTYDPDRVAFDQELLRRFYLARGYADFNVISAIAELNASGTGFFITFTVEEGEQFAFGEIGLESRLRDLEPDQLRDLMTTEPGDVYNADEVEDTIQALTDAVGELGYAFVDIQPEPQMRREDLVIDLTFVINEGPRVYVERIDIIGNVRTLDEVIRREIRLAEGDAFNTALLRRSRQRIQNLGFFETVDMQTLQGSAEDRTIIIVEVAERSTGELTFGVGFSTSDGALGDIQLRERNLLGRGQDVRAQITVSARRQEIDLSFTEPYFLDRDLSAGFDLFRRRTDFQSESSFDQRNTGLRLRASYPLTDTIRHSVRYTIREDEITKVDDDASEFIKDEEGNTITSAIGQSFTIDKRDTRFLPSSGYFINLGQDLAGLGGDAKYIRHELETDYYYSIFPDVVLNLGWKGGYIKGISDDVRLSDRFFVGGSDLRGFKFAGIGPRDTATDDALGGNVYFSSTAEVRFPLGLPEELRIFGRSFIDAGTLTELDPSGSNIDDSGNIRASAGIGLSWVSPLGPMSVDWAEAFQKDSIDETEFFRFSFGTRF